MLITTGGGGDGGLIGAGRSPHMNTAAPSCPRALFVLGPFMEPALQEGFLARAATLPNAAAIVFDAEMERIVDRAAGVVAMGGYNTFCEEILSFDKPAVIVPREKPRREQWIRASRAAALGLVTMVEPRRTRPAAATRGHGRRHRRPRRPAPSLPPRFSPA